MGWYVSHVKEFSDHPDGKLAWVFNLGKNIIRLAFSEHKFGEYMGRGFQLGDSCLRETSYDKQLNLDNKNGGTKED